MFALYLLKEPIIEIPVATTLLATALVYFGLAILLPVAGVVIYEHPFGYLAGDIRWIQILFAGVVMISLYAGSLSTMVRDLESSFKIILVVHLLFFSLQLSHSLNIFDTSTVLELWYHNRPRYGDYGYHIGRFAGATAQSSGLGLSASLAIAVFGRSYIANRENISYLILAFFLLLASGNRTSMVAVVGIIILFFIYILAFQEVSRNAFRRIVAGCAVVPPIFGVVYYFNIGRVATSDRYRELLNVFLGQAPWDEVSKRAPRREAALEYTAEYPYGTLSNAGHVLGHLDTIDSYFVLVYLQGRYPFLISFLILLCAVMYTAIRSLPSSDDALLPISMIGITVSFSLTSNFATGLSGKTVLVLTVVITMLTTLR